jgi:hypothetical protein
MNDKLDEYVDGVFAPYEGAKSISELKADLLADLHERFRELKAEGKDDTAAFELTIASIGDIRRRCRRCRTCPGAGGSDDAVRLEDLREATSPASQRGTVRASALRGADFARAELAALVQSSDWRMSFDGSDRREDDDGRAGPRAPRGRWSHRLQHVSLTTSVRRHRAHRQIAFHRPT